MKHTKGLLARGGLAAALFLLGIVGARPASAATISISRSGTVSGGVATVSGYVTSDIDQYVTVSAGLQQYQRSSPRSPQTLVAQGYSFIAWQGWVPANTPTAWIVNVPPNGGNGLAFQVGPANAYAQADGDQPGYYDYVDTLGTVSLKRP